MAGQGYVLQEAMRAPVRPNSGVTTGRAVGASIGIVDRVGCWAGTVMALAGGLVSRQDSCLCCSERASAACRPRRP